MAKSRTNTKSIEINHKRTSQGRGKIKTSSMNKHKRRSYKAYNKQGNQR